MSRTNGPPHTNQGEPAGQLAGGSIGRALIIRPGVLNDDLRAAIAAIDRVHGVTGLPRVPMEFRARMRERGRILFDSDTGLPSRILVRADADHRTVSALHEVGHFLDLAEFARAGAFGSATNPMMRDWFRATTESAAYHDLRQLRATEAAVDVVNLLLAEELWARSYAQYIAVRSGQFDLIASVDALRVVRSQGLRIPVRQHRHGS